MIPRIPLVHPITGENFPRRPVFRRLSDLGVIDSPGPYFEYYNTNQSSNVVAALRRNVRVAADEVPGGVRTSFTVPVRGLFTGTKVNAVGIHVSGLQAGDTSGPVPESMFNTQVGLSLLDDRPGKPYGISLGQGPDDVYAYLYNSYTGTFFNFDGADGQPLDLRTHRSQNYGLLADFSTYEALVYTLDVNGEINPVAVKNVGPMTDDNVDEAEIRPRLAVRSQSSDAQGYVGYKYSRLDVDLWNY